MIQSQLDEILEPLILAKCPIDIFELIEEEPILIKGNNYGNAFDGRLEYHQGKFLLFYNTYGFSKITARMRFSIAHEFAHYLIEEHRTLLVNGGKSHNSQSEFSSKIPSERDADELAANILMPPTLFGPKCSNGDLRTLCSLSEEFFTSIRSTAIRFSLLNLDPCAIVVSSDGKVQYSWPSEDLKYRGLGFIKPKKEIPKKSITYELLNNSASEDQALDGREIHLEEWVERKYEDNNVFWEQSIQLGNSGEYLTLLHLNEEE